MRCFHICTYRLSSKAGILLYGELGEDTASSVPTSAFTVLFLSPHNPSLHLLRGHYKVSQPLLECLPQARFPSLQPSRLRAGLPHCLPPHHRALPPTTLFHRITGSCSAARAVSAKAPPFSLAFPAPQLALPLCSGVPWPLCPHTCHLSSFTPTHPHRLLRLGYWGLLCP